MEFKKLIELTVGKPEYGINTSALPYDKKLPRFIRITDIGDSGSLLSDNIKCVTYKDAEGYYLKANDLLFARTGATVGKTYLHRSNTSRAAFAGYLIRFSLDTKKIDSEYLFQFTKSSIYKTWLEQTIRAGAQPNINAQEYSSLQIPYPPLSKQRKIAEILSCWDKAVEKTNHLIVVKKSLKLGIMQKLLTKGKNQGKLGQIAVVVMGQSPAGSTYNSNGIGTPLINGPTEFTERHPVKIQWTTKPTKECKKGDILFCVRGSSTGRMNISDDSYCIGRGVAAISNRQRVSDQSYLKHVLQYLAEKLIRLTSGSTFPNIDKKTIMEFPIAFHSLDDQKKIGKVLDVLDSEIETLSKINFKNGLLKKRISQRLLSGIGGAVLS
jgi:type I restriction enzyme S subunit